MNAHFDLQLDDQGIAWLAFDKADASTNVLTGPVLEDFDTALVEVAQQHPRGLVIYSGKANGFIAGADVKAFAQVRNEADARKTIERAHEIYHRLESLAFPTLALIHGFCLGGGLELALACRYRIARDDNATRLGFPEVKLGIFPGFGGSVRSLRTLGHLKALELMLSGRTVNGRTARRIGLVDQAVPERQMKQVARQLITQAPRPRRASTLAKLPGWWPLRPFVAQIMAHQVKRKVNPEHYPAPLSLLRHRQQHASDSAAMYRSEIEHVARLICSDTAQNLIRVFLLQDKLKALGDKSLITPQHVHVVGGGVMGGDIAAWCASRGLSVTLQDREPKLLGGAMARARKLFKRKLKDRYLQQQALDRLMPDPDGDGVPMADVVIEAIYEDVAAKRALYQQLEPRMAKHALLASNTSGIPLAQLREGLQRPEQLIGLHFFNPVAQMPLLEVVSDEQTPEAIRQQAMSFARHIDKLPLPVRSSPGFLVNRVLMPYLLEAVELLAEGLSPTTIDKAALQFGMPMGPIELADTVGLDVCLAVAQELGEQLDNELPEPLTEKVAAGQLGRKSGQGFYAWHKGKAQKPDAVKIPATTLKALGERMLLRLINEAVACLREGVVEDADLVDAGVIFGTGFAPFLGGPMRYVSQQGRERCELRLHELEAEYGDHFHADPGWGQLA